MRCRFSGASITTCDQNLCRHAERWDETAIDGDIAARDCVRKYKEQRRVSPLPRVYRDTRQSSAELDMERQASAESFVDASNSERTHDAPGLTVPPAFLARRLSPCAKPASF